MDALSTHYRKGQTIIWKDAMSAIRTGKYYMDTLEQLTKEEREASEAFMYAKEGEKLAPLYERCKKARNALSQFQAELHARTQYLNK